MIVSSFATRRASACVATSLAAALLCAAAGTAAQETPTVVVTGSVLPRTVGTELAASSVLTRSDLERAGVRDLVAALGLLGTAVPEQLGGPGTQAALRLRGADTRDTLVLIDGVPITDVTSGQASIASIAVDDIERIEVVRGNLSALHGGNATGGVLQIFTRRGRSGLDVSAHAGFGTRSTRGAGASLAGGSEALSARLTVGGERSDGFSAQDPAQVPNVNPDDDGYRRRFATLVADATPAPGHRLSFDLRWLRGDVAYDSSWGTPTDTHDATIDQRGLTLRGRHALTPAWSLAWHLGGNDEDRRDTTVDAFGTSTFGNRLHNRSAMAEATGTLVGTLALKVAAERLRQWTDNATYLRRQRTTDTWRVGLQDEREAGGWQLAWRHDDSSDFGTATTWLAGGRLQLAPAWSLLASASTSYTPPTLDFLYFDCSPFGFVCSNPDLRPERGRTVEVGAQWQEGPSRLRATLFHARYRDKIASDAFFVPQNLARTRNRGVEVVGQTQWAGWRASGELLWQDPEDVDTGERLLRRARVQASLRVGRDIGAFGVDAVVRHVGRRPDATEMLPAATVLGLNATWRFAKGWVAAATFDNVFDHDEVPAYGYNGRPRSVFVRVAWQP